MPLASWADLSDPSETFKQPVSSFPTPRKASNNLFHHFRRLGNLQTTCFIISEPSESFKQPVSSFPTPRKPSNNLFHHFRALENPQTTCFIISEPSGRLRTPAKFAWYGLLRYPASFPASAEAGGVRNASQESWVHDARTGVGAYRIRPHRRPAGTNLNDV